MEEEGRWEGRCNGIVEETINGKETKGKGERKEGASEEEWKKKEVLKEKKRKADGKGGVRDEERKAESIATANKGSYKDKE